MMAFRFFCVRILAGLIASCLAPVAIQAQGDPKALVINEILSSNGNTPPADHASEFEDMVEIYNPTDATIDLSSYRLGFTRNNSLADATAPAIYQTLKHDALAVAPDMPCLRQRLDHQDVVERGITGPQGRAGQVELVAQHEDEVAHGKSFAPVSRFRWSILMPWHTPAC